MARLVPHPTQLPKSDFSVEVDVSRDGKCLLLEMVLKGEIEAIHFPQSGESERRDGLWQTTCFELFLRPEGSDHYFELNYAPSGDWAAYCFDSYRANGRNAKITPCGEACHLGDELVEETDQKFDVAEAELLESATWHVGLSAVIEEADGTKSYWALAHCGEKPDFHDPDCFVARLP